MQLDNYLLCYLAVEPDVCISKGRASVTGGFTESKDEGSRDRDRDGDEDTDRDRDGIRWEKETELKLYLDPATQTQHKQSFTAPTSAMQPVRQLAN